MGIHQRVTVNNAELELRPTEGVPGRPVAVTDTVIGIGALHANTRAVLIQVTSGPVIVTYGGEDPDADTGFQLPEGSYLTLHAATASLARFVRQYEDATLYIQELN